MNIYGKISSAQFRDVVLDSWRLGRMERDLRAADLVREIKRRLLAEMQANADAAGGAAAASSGVRIAGQAIAGQAAVPERERGAVRPGGESANAGTDGESDARATRSPGAHADGGAYGDPAARAAGPSGSRPSAGRRSG